MYLTEQVGDFQVKGSGLQPKHFQPAVGESSGVYAALSKDNGKSGDTQYKLANLAQVAGPGYCWGRSRTAPSERK